MCVALCLSAPAQTLTTVVLPPSWVPLLVSARQTYESIEPQNQQTYMRPSPGYLGSRFPPTVAKIVPAREPLCVAHPSPLSASTSCHVHVMLLGGCDQRSCAAFVKNYQKLWHRSDSTDPLQEGVDGTLACTAACYPICRCKEPLMSATFGCHLYLTCLCSRPACCWFSGRGPRRRARRAPAANLAARRSRAPAKRGGTTGRQGGSGVLS